MSLISKEKFKSLRKKMGLTQEQFGEKIGVSGKYVGMIERGTMEIKDDSSIGILFAFMEKHPETAPESPAESQNTVEENGTYYPFPTTRSCRMIPLLGWAHAGDPVNYEENHERPQIPTECRDPKAFGVKLQGDSMEPTFHEHDVLVLMPSEEAYSGVFAVVKFTDDRGFVFRRVEFEKDVVRLVPVNVRYQVTEHQRGDFEWIYPVWGRWTQIWR